MRLFFYEFISLLSSFLSTKKGPLTSKWIKRLLYSNPKDGAAESFVTVQRALNWKKGREEERQK